MPHVLVLLGTRPEAIKLAPVVAALRNVHSPRGLRATVCVTGQHRDLLDGALRPFGLRPDIDLDLMRPDQTPGDVTGRALQALDAVFAQVQPDAALVQGDTATAFAGALAAFYRRVPLGHVEAGLRTGRDDTPFPEEIHRVLIARLARWHFAPTDAAAARLFAEGIARDRVHVTGSTAVDALLAATSAPVPQPTRPLLLATAHRRESLGAPLERICQALRDLATLHPEIDVAFVAHPSPPVRATVERCLGPGSGVRILAPVAHPEFVTLMRQAHLILTDSGGIQEEAPVLGKPVLVLRDASDRPEAVALGAAQVVGTETAAIVAAAHALLVDPAAHARMAQPRFPYGDGRAAERIAAVLVADLGG